MYVDKKNIDLVHVTCRWSKIKIWIILSISHSNLLHHNIFHIMSVMYTNIINISYAYLNDVFLMNFK